METSQRFAYLFRRYVEKRCTPEEKEELFALIAQAEHDDVLRRLIAETWNEAQPYYPQDKARADIILRRIIARRESGSPPDGEEAPVPAISFRQRLRKIVFNRWAAAVLAILLLPAVIFHVFRRSHSHIPLPPPSPAVAVRQPSADRCITLPDGSKIILHQSARLDYQSGFTAKRREVTLHGEAYFDIHPDARPFVVHTGTIRTTVLGTAFDIDAHNERQIVITVTKGKVRVENGKGEISILRRNEQVSVDSIHLHLQKSTVDAGEALTWKKAWLLFNDIPMREAMDELAKRYHLTVVFTNPAAENCPVTAAFTGGESVEAMIEVLTKINNMEYTIDHGRVSITGDGCN
ncbi:MAG TPA: FecR domain-containing protein [Puia sp.]|nr:FecR domain-containing protein [Puia sp.]